MSKEAMKLALITEAAIQSKDHPSKDARTFAKSVHEYLMAEQPAPATELREQEPVAWLELLREARDNCKASIVEEGISASRKEYRIDLEARLTAALNTSPPTLSLAQRQRSVKPLTDEEIIKSLGGSVGYSRGDQERIDIARAIERAHGIKENT